MALDDVMALTNRLLTSAYALAAVTARLRLGELGDEGDPAVREELDRVVDALEARELYDALDERERAIVIASSRSYLRQALDLVDDPARGPGWSYTDPVLLQAQGSASGVVAQLISRARVGSPDARILDVGTGVAGLAIALCSTFAESTVVGLDPVEPSLAIARRNVAAAGLESRIALNGAAVQEYHDADVVGTTQGDEEQALDAAVDDLRTVRSGGSVVSAADATARLERAGFVDIHEPDLGSDAPVRLTVGRRP